MTRPSKRTQVEALGWKLTAIPRHFAAGFIRCSRSGYVSPAFDDHERPEAWMVTPRPGRNLEPRRFEGRSPNAAVRWVWEQAKMQAPPAAVGGVAGLVLLAAAAGKSGVVVEGGEDAPAPARPDAELLALCREVAGCDRIAEAERGGGTHPWDQPTAHKAAMGRLREACQVKDDLIPQVIELEATTPAGALAKLQVVAGLFHNTRGRRSAAVRAAIESLARVLGHPRTAA